MEAARAAVSKITGRTGHRTDVDEVINPAVTSETIKPHRHEETTEAIDREVHQHHYHTTVQPIGHKEILPEKHVHNLIPQVEREFKHDNEAETQQRVQAELGQFQNKQTVHQTTFSKEAAPQVVGEHVHHHVHETVQPIIHKEVVQPEVVHTVVPIHETHVESAQHHGMSALPMKTLDEFTRAGGLVTGSKSHTHEEYEGAPRQYNDKLKTTIEKVLPGHHGHHGHHDNTIGSTRDSGVSGMGQDNSSFGTGRSTGGIGGTSGYDNDRTTGGLGRDTDIGTGSRSKMGEMVNPNSNYNDRDGRTGAGYGTSGTGKATMGDKMNPNTDADGDGKRGIMD